MATFYSTRLNFEFQPLRNVIKHCLQSRLFASTFFFSEISNQWPKGPISILQWGPKRGKLWQLSQNRHILSNQNSLHQKKGLWHDHDTTHKTLEYIKIQNTLVIGAQGGVNYHHSFWLQYGKTLKNCCKALDWRGIKPIYLCLSST